MSSPKCVFSEHRDDSYSLRFNKTNGKKQILHNVTKKVPYAHDTFPVVSVGQLH